MTADSGLLFTFFNVAVAKQYLPAILEGTLVTVGVGIAVVITGTLCGLVLAIARSFGLRCYLVVAVTCGGCLCGGKRMGGDSRGACGTDGSGAVNEPDMVAIHAVCAAAASDPPGCSAVDQPRDLDHQEHGARFRGRAQRGAEYCTRCHKPCR